MFVQRDRIKETTTTTGTGNVTLAGAVTGYLAFSSVMANNDTCIYCIAGQSGSEWEVGLGTFVSATPALARTKVLASSNAGALVNFSAGTKDVFITLGATTLLPTGFLFGLTMSNAADALNDITVQPGKARDDADEVDMVLTAAITKQLDATWAVGTNAGGINTGAEAASTWYEVHLIKRIDTGVVDVMFTTTANRGTLPTNYTHKRRIGWIFNDASGNIKAFTQVDDHFIWTTQVNDASVTATATAAQLTLTAPPSTIVRFRATTIGGTTVNAGMVVVFSEIVEGNVTPADTTGIASLGYLDLASPEAGHFELRLNSSSQIEHDSSNSTGNPTFDISTFGWIDHRGRMS